jgi:hypothetical protein
MFNFNSKFTNFPSFHPSVNRHFEIIIITSFHLYALADWLEARLQTSGTRTITIYLHSQIQKNMLKIFNRFAHLVQVGDLAQLFILEVTNARKLLPHGQNFGLGCSKSGYNPWLIQK